MAAPERHHQRPHASCTTPTTSLLSTTTDFTMFTTISLHLPLLVFLSLVSYVAAQAQQTPPPISAPDPSDGPSLSLSLSATSIATSAIQSGSGSSSSATTTSSAAFPSLTGLSECGACPSIVREARILTVRMCNSNSNELLWAGHCAGRLRQYHRRELLLFTSCKVSLRLHFLSTTLTKRVHALVLPHYTRLASHGCLLAPHPPI